MKRVLSEFRLYICNHLVTFVPSHTLRFLYYKLLMNFSINKGSTVYMGCTFDSSHNLYLGTNSVINSNCRIDTRGGVHIGDNVSISNEVTILTADHDITSPLMTGRNKKVIIEDYVWIGTRALILPGIKIGRGAVVAAGAVVTKDVASLEVVAGIPAKAIRKRQNEFEYSASYKRLFH